MMKQYLFFILFITTFNVFSQKCDCTANFKWVQKTIEENDAGFAFAINNKGKETYNNHTAIYKKKVATIKTLDACRQAISEWLTFLRSGHLGIRSIQTSTNSSKKKQSNAEIKASFKDWEKRTIDLEAFKKYLSEKKVHDFEGIWVSSPYTIGIKKEGDVYVGFIIEADGVYWSKGQVKLKIDAQGAAKFYLRDHSKVDFKKATLFDSNFIEMGYINLERSYPILKKNKKMSNYIKAISANAPYFERINNTTVLLRIPSFRGSEKKKIDAVIKDNKATILSTENLIIDIRNNGGGSDSSFDELLPILYTNPIRTVGVQYLSTPLNNQRMLDFINNEDYGFDEKGKKWAKESYDTLSKHIGEFVMLKKDPVSVTSFDTIHEYPKNIGIVINKGNGSTAEQFLLAAKQSKKVKLFGATTVGVLDISNMYFVNSPCNNLKLGYSLTKSLRIPEMTIDNKGIQPDYYISKDIPKQDWIEFVTEILNYK